MLIPRMSEHIAPLLPQQRAELLALLYACGYTNGVNATHYGFDVHIRDHIIGFTRYTWMVCDDEGEQQGVRTYGSSAHQWAEYLGDVEDVILTCMESDGAE